jgi:transposase
MNQAKRVFTIEFKQECVNLVLNQSYSVMQASGAMGVGDSTLRRWVRQYRRELNGITPQASAITPEQ